MESKQKELTDADACMRVRRLAISYDPPVLVVEVVRGSGPAQKLQHYRIKLKRFSAAAVRSYMSPRLVRMLDDDCFVAHSHDPQTAASVASRLREKYPDVLSRTNVQDAQVRSPSPAFITLCLLHVYLLFAFLSSSGLWGC
jgi:hypothetical protein